MSWWTDARDSFIKFGTLGAIDPAKNRADAQQKQQISDQISAYQDQTNLAKQQLDQTRQEGDAEKRRVQEKQIRSLRSNYRSSGLGMLGSGQAGSSDMDTKLGG